MKKTANQILYDNGIDTMRLDDVFNSNLFYAMEEYASQFKQPVPTEAGELTDEKFCKLYTGYHGESIDNIKQLVKATFTGYELLEFCQYLVKHLHPSQPEGDGEKYTDDFLKWRDRFFEYDPTMYEWKSISKGTLYTTNGLEETFKRAMLESALKQPIASTK